jgi:hypothetical protein
MKKVKTEYRSGCLVCGSDLVYETANRELSCSFCKQTFSSNVSCENGHYICDDCHSKPALELIKTFCIHSTSVKPTEMATEIMRSPQVRMHGPEHHYLVPAVLISAYCNATAEPSKTFRIHLASPRAEKVPGGFCGTHGNCGAGVGTGIFISVITGATSLSKEEWRLSNRMTGQSLMLIADHGGPRCCKRCTYLAIQEATRFVKEHFDVQLEETPVSCEFHENNKECLEKECPFFPG